MRPFPAVTAYPDRVLRRPGSPLDPRLRREARDARRSLFARALRGPHWRALARADLAGMRLVRSAAPSDGAARAIVRFSRSGEHGAVWLALGTVGATVDRDRRSRWLEGIAAVGVAYVANTTVKQVARRPRPQLRDLPPLIPTPTQLSFPSSHAASSFAAAAVYGDLVPRTPLVVAAGAMGTSRVYLGVHYPTDIVVGATLGTLSGRATKVALERWRRGRRAAARRRRPPWDTSTVPAPDPSATPSTSTPSATPAAPDPDADRPATDAPSTSSEGPSA